MTEKWRNLFAKKLHIENILGNSEKNSELAMQIALINLFWCFANNLISKE